MAVSKSNNTSHIYRKEMISGRPLFSGTYSPSTFSKIKSITFENAMVSKLRPSKEKWKITRKLEKMIQLITQFFVITRPDIMRGKLAWIIRSGGSKTLPPATISFGNLWTHYNRFLKGDNQSSPVLAESFNRLKKDEEAILLLNLKKQKAAALKDKKPTLTSKDQAFQKKIEEERNQFIQKNLTDIYQMKPGSSRLLLLNREQTSDQSLNGNLFCVITKQENDKYSFRLIGTGELMSELQVVPLGGKEKVMRELCYENIPKQALQQKDCLKKFITNWVDYQSTSPKQFLENQADLVHYKKEVESINDLTNYSDRTDRLFWNVVNAFPAPVKGQASQTAVEKKGLHKQVQLRTDVLTLFDLFHNVRYELKPHTEDYQTLVHVFKGISAKVDKAYRKGYLSPEEVNKLNAELAVIELAIQKAKKVPVSFKSGRRGKPEIVKGLFLKDLPIKSKENISKTLSIKPARRKEGVKPLDQPTNVPGLTSIPMEIYKNIDTKEDFLKAFNKLFEDVYKKEQTPIGLELTLQEMSRLFTEVNFQPLSDTKKEKNINSFWWNFKPEEAFEVVDKFNQCTKTLLELQKHVKPSQYNFESYLQMWRIGEFLNSAAMGKWIKYNNAEHMINDYLQEHHYNFRPYRQVSSTNALKSSYYYSIEDLKEFEGISVSLTSFNYPHKQTTPIVTYKFKKGDVEVKLPDKALKNWQTQLNLIKEFLDKPDTTQSEKISFHTTYSSINASNKSQDNWVRPFTHQGLKGLYLYATSRLSYSSTEDASISSSADKSKIKGGIAESGWNTPEAFHDNPEGIFNYFANYGKEEMQSLEGEIFSISNEDFTPEEKKKLLRLVREEIPQIEIMAFMKENPHLMRNPEVRNFVDALFFGSSFKKNYHSESFQEDMPKQIDQEIQRLEKMINEALKAQPPKDPETLRSRFDTLLYYYEMKEKLRDCYLRFGLPVKDFSSSKKELTQWLELSQKQPELQASIGYAARVHLRSLIRNHAQADFPDIIKDYALSRDYAFDDRNIDPAFEGEMMRHWQAIAKKCEESSPNLQSFLDLLCYEKDLAIDGSSWKKLDNFFYGNGTYQVNLHTLYVSKIGQEGDLVYLPSAISKHPHFKKIMGDSDENPLVSMEEKDGKKIYSFTNSSGKPMQIELKGDKIAFYTKLPIEGGKWLQILPENPFKLEKLNQLKQMQDKLKEGKMGLKAMIKEFFKMKNAAEEANGFSAFSAYRILVDPAAPTSFYCLDQKGELALNLNVKENQEGLVIQNAIDHRTSPVRTSQVNTASTYQSPALNLLSAFENKGNMLFWSQNGKIQKIELPRYQLTFNVDGDQLMCTEPFKGYSVDLSASLQEKKGIFQALVLKHPDSTKPKKLLIPDADAIVPQVETLFPKARGFGKIRLFFERIKELYQLLSGRPFKIHQQIKFAMDPERPSLSWTSFDIRPYTGEICEKRKNWESDVLKLVRLALKTDQPAEAWEMLNHIQLKPQELTPQLIKELVAFIKKPILDTGGEAALKLKLALQLKRCLKQNRQWKGNVKQTIHNAMLDLGPILFEYGRKIPLELQLSKSERIEIARMFKKNLPDYYNKHLKVYFVAEGTALKLTSPEPTVDDTLDVQIKEWKKTRASVKIVDRIELLEKTVDPDKRLSDKELSYPIPRTDKAVSLIDFTKKDEKNLFEIKQQDLPSIELTSFPSKASYEKQALKEAQASLEQFKNDEKQRPLHIIKGGKKGLKKTLNQEWSPKKAKLEKELTSRQSMIEAFVRQSKKEGEQVAIFAGSQAVASFDELRQALAFDELGKLQKEGRLPSTIDVGQLKLQLIDYFQVLTRRNAYEAVIKLAEEMLTKEEKNNQEEWESMSEALYRLLTISRTFDPYKDPRLLIFTAQQFINLKPLDGGLDQLSLLDALVKNPYGIIQAPTGAGKTAVLSVMRTLHKANGKNLVIQKVLPPLFQQTYDKFKDVLGDFYGTSIYPLRFNLKMRLSKQETVMVKNDKGEMEEKKIDHSIFKEMYLNMLETMQNKGCVLTDYKSLPLLEEMFFKIGQELVDKKAQGEDATPLQEEHFNYLRKILILLENKADENMDEFDQPNRPIQKIQVDLGVGGGLLPDFIFKQSLELYEMLLQDPELGLQANIQGDLSEETRLKIIDKYAQKMAKKLAQEAGDDQLEKDILQYIQGKNENVLALIKGQSDAYKDRLAVCKDQFSIYLPLTLRFKQGSRYMRSDDGSKTLPAYNGEKHDAKFGTPLEQINYTIQDYLQSGITLYDLKPWIKELKQKWEETDDPTAKKGFLDQFQAIFPNLTLIEASQNLQTEAGAKKMLNQINQDVTKITPFLLTRLRKMKTSGALISMDPQNNVDMSRVVSAVSATMGAPESLHRQFQVDQKMNSQIQANMIYRVKKRALQDKVIAYDPAQPDSMLKGNKEKLHAIIDGAGAYQNPVKGAEILKSHNFSLEQVGYHKEDETIGFVGKPTGDLAKTGFFFSQSHTRGTDIPFPGDAKAILTLTEKDGIREVFQKEGRLRQNRQRYLMAMPKYQGIQSVTQEIAHAITQDAAVDAKDIFRKCKQEPKAIVRAAMRKRLLGAKTPAEFVKLFENDEWRSYFITQPENSFKTAGSYFAERQHLQFEDQDPGKVLKDYKANLTQKAKDFGLLDAVEKLEKIQYSDKLLAKMPEKVAALGAIQGELEEEVEVEQEQEAEEEQEMELEFELETQQEQDKAGKLTLGAYPLRKVNKNEVYHSVGGKINSAYDPMLKVTDAFLPYSREGKASLHQKKAFDEGMYRIGVIYLEHEFLSNKIKGVIIEDPLRDLWTAGQKVAYDIRTNSFVDKNYYSKLELDPQFIPLISQIKFLDGRINGYSPQELQALEKWLKGQDPKKMRDHMLNEILCYRYQDKLDFVSSQLGQLFDQLIPLAT